MTALRGLMTPCLGGFSTPRGYAPLATLAKISKADESDGAKYDLFSYFRKPGQKPFL